MTAEEFRQKHAGQKVRHRVKGEGVLAVYHPGHKTLGVIFDADVKHGLVSRRELWTNVGWEILVPDERFPYISGCSAHELEPLGPAAKTATKTDYNDVCCVCKAPAYVGFNTVECSRGGHR